MSPQDPEEQREIQLPSPGALESDADRRRIQQEEADRKALERTTQAARAERERIQKGTASIAPEWEQLMSDRRNFPPPLSVGLGDAKVFGGKVSVRSYGSPGNTIVLWVCSNGTLNQEAFSQPT